MVLYITNANPEIGYHCFCRGVPLTLGGHQALSPQRKSTQTHKHSSAFAKTAWPCRLCTLKTEREACSSDRDVPDSDGKYTDLSLCLQDFLRIPLAPKFYNLKEWKTHCWSYRLLANISSHASRATSQVCIHTVWLWTITSLRITSPILPAKSRGWMRQVSISSTLVSL